jgi:hypothetical protein
MINLHQILIRSLIEEYQMTKIQIYNAPTSPTGQTGSTPSLEEMPKKGTVGSDIRNTKYNQDKAAGGVKHDLGKAPMDLLPPNALFEVAEILRFGAEKYAPYNWAKGMSYSRLIAAAMRHIIAFNRGENLDQETNRSHIAHALCCLMFLMEYVSREDIYKAWDDRYIWPEPPKNT